MEIHTDDRGSLYELPNCEGTQFISRSKFRVRRGDHYHILKTEYFLVLSGTANLYTYNLVTKVRIDYTLHGDHPRVIGIPPLTVHAIENVGTTELVLLVQSDHKFDANSPDTYSEKI
jgi:UDP-2-acetamido-2,6-beta-L-arabino-hexul-4-ose reductase